MTEEIRLARFAVRKKFPLAFQDYLGNVWTDDFYDHNSHQIVASEGRGTWQERADHAWILAAERILSGWETPHIHNLEEPATQEFFSL